MTTARVPLSAALAVCVALVVAALVMTFQSLALAGDGSYYLVRIIATGEVFGTDQRYLGNLIRQSPVLLAIRSEVTSTYTLALLLGVGQIVIPALLWSLAVLHARADRVAFAAVTVTAGICAGTTWFFSVSENVIAMPLTALVAVVLWQPATWSRGNAAVAIAASTVLVASYETSMVTGLVLAGWGLMRALRASSRMERGSCAAVSVLAALSVLVAVRGGWEQTYPTHSRSLLYYVVDLQPWPLYLAVAGLVALVVGIDGRYASRVSTTLVAAGTTALFVAVAGLQMTTTAAFAARGGAAVATFALLVLLWWQWAPRTEQRTPDRRSSRLLAVPVGFVVAILVVNMWALRDWASSFSTFRDEVGVARGVVAADDVIPQDRRSVLWNWTAPSLSLVVRDDPDAGVLVDPDPSFVPFEPADRRRQLPDAYTWRNG